MSALSGQLSPSKAARSDAGDKPPPGQEKTAAAETTAAARPHEETDNTPPPSPSPMSTPPSSPRGGVAMAGTLAVAGVALASALQRASPRKPGTASPSDERRRSRSPPARFSLVTIVAGCGALEHVSELQAYVAARTVRARTYPAAMQPANAFTW